ncbi:ferredoxin-fold anticodon-binding domain-containing protein 1 [Sphaeramia orbicularis]|uniref:FDX-ACB domain-containing protein n=1 Tax=Sphaeramia orbicularis TaxID=375764 RepID=A0A672ZGV0_9TELE|nr:ferredoxin-fold anticodon-binding domain-containing protein 1 [Sphaeramia orbicularis]
MTPPRSILLVGEGNFSFSASLSQLYSESDTSITATCLQHQDEALRHEGASSNIHTIRDTGGTVLFEVDCTKLEECTSLKGRVFDRVVFNFPHCGRKSGVKKNRELLKNFFLSCVQVLAEDGEVHVSLCNGQGGTLADQPKREWHNSWQVVSMASEAHLILCDVQQFESEKYQSYKCTGYRSQDKGFHVQNALLHVFIRSLPFTSAPTLLMEEDVEKEKVLYKMPAELSDYISRGLLSSDSVHPVKLVQDFLLEGLAEKWSVSMMTETFPLLLSYKQLQRCCWDIDHTNWYWIHLLQRDLTSNTQPSADEKKDKLTSADDQKHINAADTCVNADKVEKSRSKGADVLRPASSLDGDPEEERGLYMLRPSLLPHMEDLLREKDVFTSSTGSDGEIEQNSVSPEEKVKEQPCVSSNGFPSLLFGVSDVVFRNTPINVWALPAFHELLLRGVFPSESEPIKMLGGKLEKLLAPFGVAMVTEQEDMCLTAQPMGVVGKVFTNKKSDDTSDVNVTVSLNLDLLAVLLYSLPDWRLLWSHDPRFLKQFASHPPPGKPFCPFSMFPEQFKFDISFWTGPTWDEKKFHAVVREASCGTVEQVKLIDTFSHPDLSQTSYCYRLFYHTHTHALSHTQALQFHKQLEAMLSSCLQVTIR